MLGVCLLLACSRTRSADPTAAPPPRDASRSAPTPSAGAVAPTPPVVPAAVIDRCYRDADLNAGSDALLRDVAERCASGMAPLAGPARARELAFEVVRADACLRAVVTLDAPAPALDAQIEDDRGALWSARLSASRVALVPEDAAFCVDRPGPYRLRLTAPAAAEASLGVWQAR